MPFRTASTLLDTCDADTGDTPGKSTDCKFLGQSEEATTYNANRPHLALAENDEWLMSQMNFGTFIVCDPSGTDTGVDQNCDYSGASALQDALTAEGGDTTYFLRPGDYVIGSNLDISDNNVRILGASAEEPGSSGVDLQLGTGITLTMSGERIALESVQVTCASPDGTEGMLLSGDFTGLKGIYTDNVGVVVSGDNNTVVDSKIIGYGVALDLAAADGAIVLNNDIGSYGSGSPTAVVMFYSGTTAAHDVQVLACDITAATVVAAVAMSGVDASNVLENVNISACRIFGYLAGVTAVTMTHARGIRFESCFIGQATSSAGPALSVYGGGDDSSVVFDACWIATGATEERAVETSSARGLSFINCIFEAVNSGTNTEGLALLGHDTVERGHIQNCTFLVSGDVVPTSNPDVDIEGFNGVNIRVLYTSGHQYDGDTPALSLNDCNIDGITVNFGPDAPTTMTGTSAIYIVGASYAKNLTCERMQEATGSTAWAMPLIYLNQMSSSEPAVVLDGLILSPESGGDWRNNNATAPLVVQMGNNSVLRNFRWYPAAGDTGSGNHSVVRQASAGCTGVIVERCEIDVISCTGDFDYVVYLGFGGGTSYRCGIRDSRLVGGDDSNVVGESTLRMDRIEDMFILNCVLQHGTIDSTSGETCNATCCYVYAANDDAIRARIIGNTMIARSVAGADRGRRKIIYFNSTTTDHNNIVGWAAMISGNVFDGTILEADAYMLVGSSDDYNPGGTAFDTKTDDLNLFALADSA